jgi:hypothetical protein
MITLINPTLPYGFAKRHGVILLDAGEIAVVGLREGADPQAVCDKCTDDRKDKPIVGLEIIRGAKQAEGKTVWEDGKILDPENGKTYTLRMVHGGIHVLYQLRQVASFRQFFCFFF